MSSITLFIGPFKSDFFGIKIYSNKLNIKIIEALHKIYGKHSLQNTGESRIE